MKHTVNNMKERYRRFRVMCYFREAECTLATFFTMIVVVSITAYFGSK